MEWRKVWREGYRRGKRINSVGADARDLFTRLILIVDDQGATDADPNLVRAECCPRLPYCVKEIDSILIELVEHGLIVIYGAADDSYLYLPDFPATQEFRTATKPTIRAPGPDGGFVWQPFNGEAEYREWLAGNAVGRARVGGPLAPTGRRSDAGRTPTGRLRVDKSRQDKIPDTSRSRGGKRAVSVPFELIRTEWNANRGDLPGCRVVNERTKTRIQALWKEDPEFRKPERRAAAIGALARAPFYRGVNDRGWRARFAFWVGTDRHGDRNWEKGLERHSDIPGSNDAAVRKLTAARDKARSNLENAEKGDDRSVVASLSAQLSRINEKLAGATKRASG